MERKEAIEVVKKNYPHVNESGSQFETALRTLIPELREKSEDERIRKELLNAFQESEDSLYMVLTPHKRASFIAWLEKQGKNNMGISEATKQELEDNLHKALEKETPESWNEFLKKQDEQKPAWSEEDEKILNLIIARLHSHPNVEAEEYGKDYHWFNSLKDRYTWKPSGEQMDALLYIVRHYTPTATEKLAWDSLQTLELMLGQLKKPK